MCLLLQYLLQSCSRGVWIFFFAWNVSQNLIFAKSSLSRVRAVASGRLLGPQLRHLSPYLMPPLAAVKAMTCLAWMMVAFDLARASDASMTPALRADTPSAAPAPRADTPSIRQWHPLVSSMPACTSSGHIYLAVGLSVGLPVCTSAGLHAYSHVAAGVF